MPDEYISREAALQEMEDKKDPHVHRHEPEP